MTKLVKSPLNYTGGKYKLLPQILPLFPQSINTFVDLFGGGFNVGSNVKAHSVIYNEVDSKVYEIIENMVKTDSALALKMIKSVISQYKLSKDNEDGYYALREAYNNSNAKKWYEMYAIITHAFNYQIRFNKKGEFNMPFGKNRSHFSETLQKKFVEFSDSFDNKEVSFFNKDFSFITSYPLEREDLIYCDPPYLITTASYNEKSLWSNEKEKRLLSTLSELNEQGARFALSNVLEHKGKSNDLLKEWAQKYNIHYIKSNYSNCSYHGKDKSKESVEVLITNY